MVLAVLLVEPNPWTLVEDVLLLFRGLYHAVTFPVSVRRDSCLDWRRYVGQEALLRSHQSRTNSTLALLATSTSPLSIEHRFSGDVFRAGPRDRGVSIPGDEVVTLL